MSRELSKVLVRLSLVKWEVCVCVGGGGLKGSPLPPRVSFQSSTSAVGSCSKT